MAHRSGHRRLDLGLGRGRPWRISRRQGGELIRRTRFSSASFWLLTAPRNWPSRASNCSPHRAAAASRIAAASSARSRITVLSRSLDPVSLSSRTWPRTTTVSCRRSVASPRRAARLSPCTTMVCREPLAAALEPLDQRVRSVGGVTGECVVGEAQLTGDRVALGADRVDGLLAARADPGHDLV